MQEIKKRRIVLASVLKPVNDPRMFDKIGMSLSRKYEVHLIGQPGNNDKDSNILFHALSPFTRLSFGRLLAPLKILKHVRSLKPDLLIICTHELLGVALLTKVLTRCKIIYDIQENYAQNIIHGNAFPSYLRWLIASYVRTKEWLLSPLIDYYFLAESTYQHELRFTKKRRVVLENKLKKIPNPVREKMSVRDGNIHLVFSGTIAETTGVFNAIRLAVALHQVDPRIRLEIIGYCSLLTTLTLVRSEIAHKPFINLTGGDTLVPHADILLAIQSADFGIIAYPPNPSTANAMPTKLFEYLGCQLPILLINNPSWAARCEPYQGCILFDPEHLKPQEILREMTSKSFFTHPPADVYWESEESKLLITTQLVMDMGKG